VRPLDLVRSAADSEPDPEILDRVTPAAAPSTFADVFEHRYVPMVRLAHLTTGSNALAEELVQDAFVDLFRHWDNVKNPKAWLRRAVTSRSTSWVRRQVVERRYLERADQPEPVILDDSLLLIQEALRVLNHRQRAAIVLCLLEGASEAEAAHALNCKPGTIKSLLSRAKAKMKEELTNE